MTTPTTLTLERRLTLQELRDLTEDGHDYIDAVVRIDLDDLIANDMEWLNDTVNERVLPEGFVAGLMDYSYNVVGHAPAPTTYSWGGGSVLIHVSADASETIAEMEEGEEESGE